MKNIFKRLATERPQTLFGWSGRVQIYRTGTAGDGRFHRPRQLGVEFCGGVGVRLLAAVGGDALYRHADNPATQRGAPGHRDGTVPVGSRHAVHSQMGVAPYIGYGGAGFHIHFPCRNIGRCHRAANVAGHPHNMGSVLTTVFVSIMLFTNSYKKIERAIIASCPS